MNESRCHFLTGTVDGKTVRGVVSDGGLTIGREHTCGLQVVDPAASRLHCIVRPDGGRIVVEDKSRNGTFVNGAPIAGPTEIKVGDTVRIGAVELKLQEGEVPPPPPAAAPAEPETLPAGAMIDRYRVVRLIGKGGMGTVYEVVHTGLDLPRALKALTLPDDATYAAFRDKFLDEGKMLARLKHDNITQVYDAAYDEKTRTLFFVMDLVLYDDGKPCTLADVAYDECDVNAWFTALASALDYVHGQGIVHSDIKLQNVLVSPGQKIKLADFGVAHLLSGKMRASLHGGDNGGAPETIGYTPHYVSPEILAGGMPSAASDVYALGVMLVRLLSGKWYDEHPEVLAEIATKRSLNWKPILVQMLSPDPKKRVTDLTKLVQQLRHGSKAPIRRKYQIENRRRRSQKIRLQRVPGVKTEGLRPTAFVPEPLHKKIIRWSAWAGIALAVVVGLLWMHKVDVEKEAAEKARLEKIQDAHEKAKWKLKKTHDALMEGVAALKVAIGQHRQEYAFVEALSKANVIESTDRSTAARRNDVILRYAEVLQKIEDVRTALAACKRECDGLDMRLQSVESVAATERAVADFEANYKLKQDALAAACTTEAQKWTAYAQAKAVLEQERLRRQQIEDVRRGALETVRQMVEAEKQLKAEPEFAKAREKIAAGDKAAAGGSDGYAAAAECYAEVAGILSNGCVRLQKQRTERDGIEKSFQRADDSVRTALLPKLRHGQLPATTAAFTAKELSAKFSEKWNPDGVCPINKALAEEYAFCLAAQSVYLGYVANRLSGNRDGLNLALTPTGVSVKNGRFTYQLKWSDLLSSRKMSISVEERARREVQYFLNVPMELKVSAQPLIGRWIVLKELMPEANDEEQKTRLVEAIRKDGSAAALACGRRLLPEAFPVEAAPAPAPEPEADAEEIPDELAGAQPDPDQERLVFFEPLRGLTIPAIGLRDTGLAKCQQVKGKPLYRVHVENGEISINGSLVQQPFVDIEVRKPFEVRYVETICSCRYELVAWIENALGSGRPLVLVRCQHLQEATE